MKRILKSGFVGVLLATLLALPVVGYASSAGFELDKAIILKLLNSYLHFQSGQGNYKTGVFESYFENSSPAFSVRFDGGATDKGIAQMQTDGTAFSDTAGDINLIYAGRYVLAMSPTTSGGATLPAQDATGLDTMAGNDTDSDVNEYFSGVLGASGRPYWVGIDPAFYACAKLKIVDVSDSANINFGFQGVNSTAAGAILPNATVGSHLNYALIGSVSGDIKTQTGIAGTDVITDTTDNWADNETHRVCVFVSGAGAVTYTLDGAAPTTVVAATLSSGIGFVPYLYEINSSCSAACAEIYLLEWTTGFQ